MARKLKRVESLPSYITSQAIRGKDGVGEQETKKCPINQSDESDDYHYDYDCDFTETWPYITIRVMIVIMIVIPLKPVQER